MATHLETLEKCLQLLKPLMAGVEEHVYEKGSEDSEFWPIIKRGVVARQFEALSAILQMSPVGFAFLGVTFLRPAFEELIWLEFIDGQIPNPREFIKLMSLHELSNHLKAQNDYVGKRAMTELGFTQRFIKLSEAKDREVTAKIRAVGKQVGWDTSRLLYPTMLFMTKRTGRVKEYNYLYAATSRFVHFSPQELMRRAWGQPGRLKIGSAQFGKYWETFAVYWGFRIFINVLVHCHDLLPDEDEAIGEMTNLLADFSPVPIVTMEELHWPFPR